MKLKLEVKTQNKMPHWFTTLAEHFKTKYCVLFFAFPKGEKTYVITLEVYNVKTLEVYKVKALEVSVFALNTRGVVCSMGTYRVEFICPSTAGNKVRKRKNGHQLLEIINLVFDWRPFEISFPFKVHIMGFLLKVIACTMAQYFHWCAMKH